MERWRISLARIMTHQSALRSRKLLRATFLATFRPLLLLRLRASFAFCLLDTPGGQEGPQHSLAAAGSVFAVGRPLEGELASIFVNLTQDRFI